ncbi:hypothetical protein LR48_Vigan304s002400 [Vigna angularis]|uniref:Uncharacterized protein n=1 Tax=Phaseolus angularis TaxID=3914 RepID=A0A0L9T7W0_PHAAN|nr:hypothetical protein LR48_Vigan304s002400 [Vigna angularis]
MVETSTATAMMGGSPIEGVWRAEKVDDGGALWCEGEGEIGGVAVVRCEGEREIGGNITDWWSRGDILVLWWFSGGPTTMVVRWSRGILLQV